MVRKTKVFDYGGEYLLCPTFQKLVHEHHVL
jgi:hypothetical protein